MRPHRLVVLVAVACLAVGALGGVAAANGVTEDTTIGTNESVTVGDNGGYLDVTCIGTVTDHECDKEGELDAGPASVDYDGFNDDSLEDRRSDFGDHFVITVNDQGAVVAFTCDIDTDPSAENPCPVTAEQYEDEGNNGQSDERSDDDGNNGDNGQGDDNNNAPDHSNRP